MLRTHTAKLGLAACLASGIIGVAVGASGASAASWALQSFPDAGSFASLRAISCPSSSDCTSVGQVSGGDFGSSVAANWNGMDWSLQSTPEPANTPLGGVSCVSASACEAVGISEGSGSPSRVTRAEVWNGANWSIQATPNPGTTWDVLSAVSCTSSAACTAVGFLDSGPNQAPAWMPLAERWNGSAWKAQSVPSPADGTTPRLTGVSCFSSSRCVAVGWYYNGSAYVTLAVAWNGGAWSIQSTPNPLGAGRSELNAVSCASAKACTAVGFTDAGPLVERWDGTIWTMQSAPGKAGTVLNDVSCPAVAACTAVGNNSTSPVRPSTSAIAEHWNGTSWTMQTPVRPGDSSAFAGVSCSTDALCSAVGNSRTAGVVTPLVERFS